MKKKYFIAHVIDGKAAGHIVWLADRVLHKKYAIPYVFKKFLPHFTFKAPFYATDDQAETVYGFLKKFMTGREEIPVSFFSFGHFGDGVIYVDIMDAYQKLAGLRRELCDALEAEFEWIEFQKLEPSDITHVTIAEKCIRGRFPIIYQDLVKEFGAENVPHTISTVDVLTKAAGEEKWNQYKETIFFQTQAG